jgi:predicted aspartyl protease
MIKILYKSSEVRSEIINMFSSSKGRKVAITAFVGEGAEAYLPKPKKIQLICWPKAGGTNPYALRQLIKIGVKVFFVDSLHIKLYWTEDAGAILTSANLSTNALGSGNLKEMGILMSSTDVDIDKIISFLKPRKASPLELLKLDRQSKIYHKINPNKNQTHKPFSFKDWYESFAPSLWKLGWFACYGGDFCLKAIEFSKKEYGVKPYTFVEGKKGDYEKEDWILYFKIGKKSISDFHWIYAEKVFKVSQREKDVYNQDYPYQAIQIWSIKHYPSQPFVINNNFRNAFKKGIQEFGGPLKIKKYTKPPKRLLDLIYKCYIKQI